MSETTTPVPPDAKATLHRYLRVQRDHLLGKLDGLDERQLEPLRLIFTCCHLTRRRDQLG